MHSFKGWGGRGPQCRGNGGCAERSGMSSQYSVCPPVVQIMETSQFIWSSDGSFTDLHCFLKTGNGLRNVRWPNRIAVIILNPHICRVGLVVTSAFFFPVAVNMNHAVVTLLRLAVLSARRFCLSEVTGVLLSSQQTRTILDLDSLPCFR